MIKRFLVLLFISLGFLSFGFAQMSDSWGTAGSDPRQVLDTIEKKSNPKQQTKLDRVSDI